MRGLSCEKIRDLSNVHVERQGIFAGNIPHFPTVTSRRTEASDHGAVVADFVIQLLQAFADLYR